MPVKSSLSHYHGIYVHTVVDGGAGGVVVSKVLTIYT